MKTVSEFRLVLQAGRNGYFGEIELEIEVLDEGTGIEISIPEDFREWRNGILFGIAYAHEKSRILLGKAARVRVIDVRGHAVDTTETLMAFVAANAVWKALNETPSRAPTLNAAERVFLFPT